MLVITSSQLQRRKTEAFHHLSGLLEDAWAAAPRPAWLRADAGAVRPRYAQLTARAQARASPALPRETQHRLAL